MSLRTLAVAAPVLLALGTSCNQSTGAAGPGEQPLRGELQAREATRVRTTPVVRQEMVRPLTTTATVESEQEIEFFPRASGVVMQVIAEEGDRVQQGDLLAVVDPREANAALDDALMALREAREAGPGLVLATREAASRLEKARLSWEQAKTDYERKASEPDLFMQQELDQARTTRDLAKSDLDAAEIALDRAKEAEKNQETAIERAQLAVERQELNVSYTELRAPFDGVIARRDIRVGDTVSTGATAFVLTDPEHLKAVFFRPQRELPLFRAAEAAGKAAGEQGSEIEIRAEAEAIPGRVFPAKVRRVSPTVDAASGSFRITIDLEQPPIDSGQPRLLPGMMVRLVVVTERHPDALVVPKRALQREGELSLLYKVVDGRAVRVEVREGFANDDEVEVLPLGGFLLDEGDQVVVVGNRDLEDGEEVSAEPWQDPGGPSHDDADAAGGERS